MQNLFLRRNFLNKKCLVNYFKNTYSTTNLLDKHMNNNTLYSFYKGDKEQALHFVGEAVIKDTAKLTYLMEKLIYPKEQIVIDHTFLKGPNIDGVIQEQLVTFINKGKANVNGVDPDDIKFDIDVKFKGPKGYYTGIEEKWHYKDGRKLELYSQYTKIKDKDTNEEIPSIIAERIVYDDKGKIVLQFDETLKLVDEDTFNEKKDELYEEKL